MAQLSDTQKAVAVWWEGIIQVVRATRKDSSLACPSIGPPTFAEPAPCRMYRNGLARCGTLVPNTAEGMAFRGTPVPYLGAQRPRIFVHVQKIRGVGCGKAAKGRAHQPPSSFEGVWSYERTG